jgi:hypothetical protein
MKKKDKVKLGIDAAKVWGILAALVPVMILIIVIILGARGC